jgi:hypothetical protein
MPRNKYTKLNENLGFDCIEKLNAHADTTSQFVRYYNSEIEKSENFQSLYEQGKPIPVPKTDIDKAKHRGISVNKIREENPEQTIEFSKRKLANTSTKFLDEMGWNKLFIFKITCVDELIADTPSNRNRSHRTLLKSDHFDPDDCLSQESMLSL